MPNFDPKPQTLNHPLLFDDQRVSGVRTPTEWKAMGFPLKAHALRRDSEEGGASYKECVVIKLSENKKNFLVKYTPLEKGYQNSLEGCEEVEGLHVYFEGEDLEVYARRVASCHQRRRYAESLLKYNFFVDNMPITEKVGRCSSEIIERVTDSALGGGTLRKDREELSINQLTDEVSNDYTRTMNKIIFDKIVASKHEKYLLSELELPEEKEEEVPYKGVKCMGAEIDFREYFSSFCTASLRIRPEVVVGLIDIQAEIQSLLGKLIFRREYATDGTQTLEYAILDSLGVKSSNPQEKMEVS